MDGNVSHAPGSARGLREPKKKYLISLPIAACAKVHSFAQADGISETTMAARLLLAGVSHREGVPPPGENIEALERLMAVFIERLRRLEDLTAYATRSSMKAMAVLQVLGAESGDGLMDQALEQAERWLEDRGIGDPGAADHG